MPIVTDHSGQSFGVNVAVPAPSQLFTFTHNQVGWSNTIGPAAKALSIVGLTPITPTEVGSWPASYTSVGLTGVGLTAANLVAAPAPTNGATYYMIEPRAANYNFLAAQGTSGQIGYYSGFNNGGTTTCVGFDFARPLVFGNGVTNGRLVDSTFVFRKCRFWMDNVPASFPAPTGAGRALIGVNGFGSDATGCTFIYEDCEFGPFIEQNPDLSGGTSGARRLQYHGGTNHLEVRRCYLHPNSYTSSNHVKTNITYTSDADGGQYNQSSAGSLLYEDNWVDGLYNGASTAHIDCWQTVGCSNVTLRRNWFDMDGNTATSCIMMQFENSSGSNVIIDDNHLRGGSFSIYTTTGGTSNTMSNLRVRNNVWTRNTYSNGPWKIESVTPTQAFGNHFDDEAAGTTSVGPNIP